MATRMSASRHSAEALERPAWAPSGKTKTGRAQADRFAGENKLTNLLNAAAKTDTDFPVVQTAGACGFLDIAISGRAAWAAMGCDWVW